MFQTPLTAFRGATRRCVDLPFALKAATGDAARCVDLLLALKEATGAARISRVRTAFMVIIVERGGCGGCDVLLHKVLHSVCVVCVVIR